MAKKLTILSASLLSVAVLALGTWCFIRARSTSAANACINGLRQIDSAVQQWALEHEKTENDIPTWDDVLPYIKGNARPICSGGGTYTIGRRVTDSPHCSIMWHNFDFGHVAVSDESGVPLADVRVAVRGRGEEVCSSVTGTNGAAYFEGIYTNFWEIQTNSVNSWSNRMKEIVATKAGYRAERIDLPTSDWPVKFTLKKVIN